MSNARTVLTRAARIKAGLSPPPSLYGTKKQSPIQRSSSVNEISSCEASPETKSKDDDCNKQFIWVQCDSCYKWRKINSNYEKDLKDNWYCHNNLDDPYHQSCDQPEEDWENLSSGWIYTYQGFVVGQLVWGKMDTYPPWPGIITRDPWCSDTFVSHEEDLGGFLYHLEFLGKVRSHLWLPQEMVEPYRESCSIGRKSWPKVDWKNNKQLQYAISQADKMLKLTNEERISQCEYTTTRKVKLETKTRQRHKKIKLDSEPKEPLQAAICSSKSTANSSALDTAASTDVQRSNIQVPILDTSLIEFLTKSIVQHILIQDNTRAVQTSVVAKEAFKNDISSNNVAHAKRIKAKTSECDYNLHRKRQSNKSSNDSKKLRKNKSEKGSQSILQYFEPQVPACREPLVDVANDDEDKNDQIVPDTDDLSIKTFKSFILLVDNLEQEAQDALMDIEKMLSCLDSAENEKNIDYSNQIDIEEMEEEMSQIEELLSTCHNYSLCS